MKRKILYLDIETSSAVTHNWGLYQQNGLHIERDWKLLMISYQWEGEREAHVKYFQKSWKNDKALAKVAWGLLNKADIVVYHNGDKFDKRKLYAKFVEHRLAPPRPFQSVDTKKAAKRHFMFTSNKLDHIGQLARLGRKVETGGYGLWLACYEGKDWAWRRMAKYAKQDVVLLRKVYKWMLPYIDGHPAVRPDACPNCGSKKIKSNGWKYSKVMAKRHFLCKSCGKYFTSSFGSKRFTRYSS